MNRRTYFVYLSLISMGNLKLKMKFYNIQRYACVVGASLIHLSDLLRLVKIHHHYPLLDYILHIFFTVLFTYLSPCVFVVFCGH